MKGNNLHFLYLILHSVAVIGKYTQKNNVLARHINSNKSDLFQIKNQLLNN